jgi:hypothetical protein
MICYKCSAELADQATIGFNAVCDSCGSYLHCCRQCRLLNTKTGRCTSSTTDAVRDLEDRNYCEEFQPRRTAPGGPGRPADEARERFRDLFRDSD